MDNDTPPISDDFRQRVLEAVTKLQVRGERASIRLVRAEMGGGSPNWIAAVLRDQRAAEKPNAPDATEHPDLAAARLLVPGLVEQIEAKIEAKFSARFADQQHELEEARAMIRDQFYALEDIQAENSTVHQQNGNLTRQIEQMTEMMSLLTQVSDEVHALNERHREFSERSQEAWQAARSERAGIAGLFQASVDTQAEIAANVDGMKSSVERLAATQVASVDTIIAQAHAGTQRVLERVHTLAVNADARDYEAQRSRADIRRRLSAIAARAKPPRR